MVFILSHVFQTAVRMSRAEILMVRTHTDSHASRIAAHLVGISATHVVGHLHLALMSGVLLIEILHLTVVRGVVVLTVVVMR